MSDVPPSAPSAEPLLSASEFSRRLRRSVLVFAILVASALLIGAVGYHWLAGLAWVDAILNASMILTGMGPVSPMTSDAAKLFASAYAIFSGVVFLAACGVILSPMVHRFLHRFHIDLEESGIDVR